MLATQKHFIHWGHAKINFQEPVNNELQQAEEEQVNSLAMA